MCEVRSSESGSEGFDIGANRTPHSRDLRISSFWMKMK